MQGYNHFRRCSVCRRGATRGAHFVKDPDESGAASGDHTQRALGNVAISQRIIIAAGIEPSEMRLVGVPDPVGDVGRDDKRSLRGARQWFRSWHARPNNAMSQGRMDPRMRTIRTSRLV